MKVGLFISFRSLTVQELRFTTVFKMHNQLLLWKSKFRVCWFVITIKEVG